MGKIEIASEPRTPSAFAELLSRSASADKRNDARYGWLDNPDVQKLLDVVCEIIANEYIGVAKRNKGVFEIASPATFGGEARNDNEGGMK